MGAILTASFEDIKVVQLEGYGIWTAWIPRLGFEGHFQVVLMDWIEANEAFDPVKFSNDSKAQRGELILSDGSDITYKFPDIDLRYAVVGATRANRYRFFVFQYDQRLTDRGNPVAISLENKSKRKLTSGSPGDAYNYKLDNTSEPLLGYRTRLSPNESTLVRFSTLRNDSNSFLQKVIEINKAQAQSAAMPSFTVGFSQQTFEVTQNNLNFIFVNESFGVCAAMPLPSLDEILHAGPAAAQLAQPRFVDFTPEQLLHHDIQRMRQRFVATDIVETATLVFQAGHYGDQPIT